MFLTHSFRNPLSLLCLRIIFVAWFFTKSGESPDSNVNPSSTSISRENMVSGSSWVSLCSVNIYAICINSINLKRKDLPLPTGLKIRLKRFSSRSKSLNGPILFPLMVIISIIHVFDMFNNGFYLFTIYYVDCKSIT